MKNFSIVLLVFLSFQVFGQNNKTKIIVIGNIHQSVPNYNSDTLFNILKKIRPDIILHEIDSSFFTSDFKFKYPSEENEQNAAEKYLKEYPKTKLRPFDFEGRNEYRKEKGMRPTDNLTIKMLDSLNENGLLTKPQSQILVK